METFLSNDTIFSSTNIKFPWFYCTNRPSHSCNNLANVAGKSKEIVGKSQATGKEDSSEIKKKESLVMLAKITIQGRLEHDHSVNASNTLQICLL